MDCNIRLYLYELVDISKICLVEGSLRCAQRGLGFHGADFAHFFRMVNNADIYRKAFQNFHYIMCFVSGIDEQFACLIMQHNSHLLMLS